MPLSFQPARIPHLPAIVGLYQQCFQSEMDHALWVRCTYRAYPRFCYYVALQDEEVLAYLLWGVRNGFRRQSILELEQIAVAPEWRHQGIASRLLQAAYDQQVQKMLAEGYQVDALMVTTRAGNPAEQLYVKALGVKPAGLIERYGNGDERILYRRLSA